LSNLDNERVRRKASSRKVKIVVGYPPIESKKGVALLSQNRQFQYFNAPTYIYPMIPAYAASNLQDKGYQTYWMDGIAERKKYVDWIEELREVDPDYLMVETKSPIVKKHLVRFFFDIIFSPKVS